MTTKELNNTNGSLTAEPQKKAPRGLQNITKKKGIGLAAIFGTMLALVMLLIGGKSKTAHADENNILTVSAPEAIIVTPKVMQHFQVDVLNTDDLAVTTERNVPVNAIGISKNPEVVLTERQQNFAQQFADFLSTKRKFAIVTSGTRSSDGQLEIIKQRIVEKNATKQFPQIATATLEDTSVWLKAWQWLAAHRVPVNSPMTIKGEYTKVSRHITGRAMDFISSDLDQLRSMFAQFQRSTFAKKAQLKIVSIVREPGCIHLNLDPA